MDYYDDYIIMGDDGCRWNVFSYRFPNHLYTDPTDIYTKMVQWIRDIVDPETMEDAMQNLCDNRGLIAMGLIMWHSTGVVAAILREILNIFDIFDDRTLTLVQSKKLCNVIKILQIMVTDPNMQYEHLDQEAPIFVYPLLKYFYIEQQYEDVRHASIELIHSLASTRKEEVISFLITTKFIPICLDLMEKGITAHERTLAANVLEIIVVHDIGLEYICRRYQRLVLTLMPLGKTLISLVENPIPNLFMHILRCYLRFCSDVRGLLALHYFMPNQMKDNTFIEFLRPHVMLQYLRINLLWNLDVPVTHENI